MSGQRLAFDRRWIGEGRGRKKLEKNTKKTLDKLERAE
jgi:hypothetical protein